MRAMMGVMRGFATQIKYVTHIVHRVRSSWVETGRCGQFPDITVLHEFWGFIGDLFGPVFLHRSQ